MSWLDPPPLVKKPSAPDASGLPSGVKPERVRAIVVLGILSFGASGAILGYAVSAVLAYAGVTSADVRLPVAIAGGVAGMSLGAALSLRALTAAVTYGRLRKSGR